MTVFSTIIDALFLFNTAITQCFNPKIMKTTKCFFFNAFIFFIAINLLCSCSTTKKVKKELFVLRSEKQLKSDVDYVHKKLEKLHPDLYWYISKKDLDLKFDSLKACINKPMTSFDFYFKLAPVVAAIKQGHTTLMLPSIKGNTQYGYEIFDNKLYIVKSHSNDSIKFCTEVVAVNEINVQKFIGVLKNTISNDGYNETHKNKAICERFEWLLNYLPIKIHITAKNIDTIITAGSSRKVVSDSTTFKAAIKHINNDTTVVLGIKFLKPDSSVGEMQRRRTHPSR